LSSFMPAVCAVAPLCSLILSAWVCSVGDNRPVEVLWAARATARRHAARLRTKRGGPGKAPAPVPRRSKRCSRLSLACRR
jgi:hypothetical protein